MDICEGNGSGNYKCHLYPGLYTFCTPWLLGAMVPMSMKWPNGEGVNLKYKSDEYTLGAPCRYQLIYLYIYVALQQSVQLVVFVQVIIDIQYLLIRIYDMGGTVCCVYICYFIESICFCSHFSII